ncbi:pantoate--beta-alanine ligase [Pseudolabrys taiwanensis]|uniref:Pantothenate synthetase n=1 Tax=Pseudolabrys taiwanensis TaxID=331696 RepID=A0A345ZS41_9HYPH|nr:pantoate--beta-alanine ligase [Pseudolabrys taiwanensis]AXK79738.1 pantoate--beta-alanine ligase [Pseudolabrys taiwanensis]
MPRRPIIARTVPVLRKTLSPFRRKGERIALVPTMGALHQGHLTLVKEARKRADRVVVSIFVNPTQFAPNEDFGSYPRTFDTDVKALAEAKADVVWAPTPQAMYPEGFATRIAPEGAALTGLEDKFRPHFFGGVATVVAKLFTQVQPDVALFGQKDYQQLQVVTQMAKDLDLAVKVVGIPTVREKDGLALSSRNAYLSAAERAVAPVLARVLKAAAQRIKQGEPSEMVLEEGRAEIARAGFAVDYLEARHAVTLAPIASLKDGPIRLLVAAKIGKTRLIDNLGV